MKFKSLIFSQASGSIAGMTFSHGIGGMYVRARATPTNPGSTYQDVVRAAFGSLVVHWQETLTEAQREDWRTYASNTPLVDPLGELIQVTGLNMYLRGNTPRLNAGLSRVDDAPTLFNLGGFTEPSVAFDATDDEIDVTFTNSDDWANESGSAMLVYVSRPQSVATQYFKGPYRLAGIIEGDDTTPPTSPAEISLPFAATVGQKLFAKLAVTRADGRRSLDFRTGNLAA